MVRGNEKTSRKKVNKYVRDRTGEFKGGVKGLDK